MNSQEAELTQGLIATSGNRPPEDELALESGSDISDSEDESFAQRVAALKDVIPYSTRTSVINTFFVAFNYGKYGAKLIGNLGWILTTSALLVAFPLGYQLEREKAAKEFDQGPKESQQLMQSGLLGPEGPSHSKEERR